MMSQKRKLIPIWLLIALLVFSAAGAAAAGTILNGKVTGIAPVAVSSSILIDRSQFDTSDVSTHAARKMVSVSDDRTSFSAAAEIATGDEVTIDVPLINVSENDAYVELTLDYPSQIYAIAEPFWVAETYSFSVAGGTITRTGAIPAPAPFTDTLEQSKDSTAETNIKPTTTTSISPQTGNGATTNAAPAGSPAITANSANTPSKVNINPAGLEGNIVSTVDAPNMVFVKPSDLEDNVAQSGDTAPFTTAKPDADLPGVNGDSKWYMGQFTVDVNSDGIADTVRFVLTDVEPDGDIDFMDISVDDADFGEGGNLGDGVADADNDERIAAMTNVRLGSPVLGCTFSVEFDADPEMDLDDARVTSVTWFTGTFAIDTDSSGDTDTVNFALKDHNADGLYDRMGISVSDADYGDGDKGDQFATAADDELITGSEDVTLGTDYTFTFYFDSNPLADASDASVLSITWFTGTFAIDTDSSGITDTVNFALKDHNSDGLYDRMGISINDADYGDGATGDQFATAADDELITGSEDVILGVDYKFTFYFDSNPPADASDASALSITWFIGTLNLDANADGDKTDLTDTLKFVLTDTDSNGIYQVLDLSFDDAIYGEGGLLGDAIASITGNDESLVASIDLTLGRYLFTVGFTNNPGSTLTDVSITSKTWFTSDGFTGTPFEIDADGDGLTDDKVAWAVSDTNTDGLYDMIDLSMDDTVFGDGDTSDSRVGFTQDNDEAAPLTDVLVFGDTTNAYAPYFTISRLDGSPVTPAGDADPVLDVGIMSPWYVGVFNIDIDGDQIPNALDFVLVDPGISDGIYTKLNIDRDDSGAYVADEVHESSDLIMLGGMKIEVTFPETAATLTFRQGKIITVVQKSARVWLIKIPAPADVGDTQDNVRIKVVTPDDVLPGYYTVTGIFRQVKY